MYQRNITWAASDADSDGESMVDSLLLVVIVVVAAVAVVINITSQEIKRENHLMSYKN